MGTVPSNHTWVYREKPNFRQMEAYLADVITFLTNPPMVRLRKTSAQTITTSTSTAVSWNFVEIETVNFWDSTSPTRIKPSVPGWYFGSTGLSFTQSANGYREVEVKKNGSTTDRVLRVKADASTNAAFNVATRGHTFLEVFNGTTDYIEVIAWQNSGISLDVSTDLIERQPDLSLRWVAAL